MRFPLLWGCLWLLGCASLNASGTSSNRARFAEVDALLVAPFEALSRSKGGGIDRCPICQAVLDTGPVEPGAAHYMTRQLMAHLKAASEFTLWGPGTASGVRARILSEDLAISHKRLLIQMGQEMGADAVVGGIVYRFQQRVGTGLSVQSPASVGFGLHLIRCSDGQVLWSDHFDETQQNLSENLLKIGSFFKRGGQWLTVEQLAAYGMQEVMKSFPVRK
jgi:hypothetical protein